MAPTALFIAHRTKPGQRAAVHAVWRKYMATAIAQNTGHNEYFYCFEDTDPDVICAFQQYRSEEDAAAFLKTDAYRSYEAEVAPLLAGPPAIRRMSPVWSKGC